MVDDFFGLLLHKIRQMSYTTIKTVFCDILRWGKQKNHNKYWKGKQNLGHMLFIFGQNHLLPN